MSTRQSERRGEHRRKPGALVEIRIAVAKSAPLQWRTAKVVDFCLSGLGIELSTPLNPGDLVLLQGKLPLSESSPAKEERATVVWCLRRTDGSYASGLRLETSRRSGPAWARQDKTHSGNGGMPAVDHYEVLMLSANADPETIHRVYRLLAQRYHPDNPDSGDAATFRQLLESYRVLSDPERRASFDAQRLAGRQQQFRIFTAPHGVNGADSEKHKREMILSLLYRQRTQDPDHPHLSIRELEDLLGYPRDHLQVSFWFLKEKQYLTRSDNGLYSITVDGFEHVEAQDPITAAERRLLTTV
jgi:hypothetical protein